ncbi:glutamate racemase [Brachybacterium squillarum]|uniref:glutamate racemase n=1 Tax=Brachybacterium squillarum TaxID=661979 RepID=UPI002221C680|nr:glutamate racemase [Brachybacterium squillarum]MCW1803915.1 glutamate racemase [Brachybacterium squillarum]
MDSVAGTSGPGEHGPASGSAPIGVFDSGVGGLTVARAILDQLPGEEILYIGDTAHTPYGPRPIAEVRALALDIMDSLVERDVKMLVIACNTASAAVLRDARERYDVPVVEVIQPAVRRAVAATRNGKVGIIGTRATISSRAYDDAFAAAPALDITSAACPRFVEFVERGEISGDEVVEVAEEYLSPVKAAGVDTLVLGCTHYPMLAGPIRLVMGPEVTLVSSAEETALDVYRQLRAAGIQRTDARPPQHVFAETADGLGGPSMFARLSRRFLGPAVTMTTTLPVVVP